MQRTIRVLDYDPAWVQTFERLRDEISGLVGDVAFTVEHVGSTAVPGLAAKPIIDLDLVVRAQDVAATIERLAAGAYRHLGNLGIEGREAFEEPPSRPPHHLYVCVQDGRTIRNHLALRDHLRDHPDAAREYANLKRRLARKFPHDIDRYVAGKTPFIMRILRRRGLPPDDLRIIEGENG